MGELEQAVLDHGSKTAAAKALGLPRSTFRSRLKKEQSQGYNIPLGLKLKGTSTLYDLEGNEVMKWVKTDSEKERLDDALEEALEALKEEVPRAKITPAPDYVEKDLLSCYVLTDYHLGQLSWGEETGDDWDTDIASELLVNWFARAIECAPDSEVGILAQLGDFLHWDGIEAVTPTSGHILDADSRFPKLVNVAIKVLRAVIQMMLEKHGRVHVIMAEGNHDIASSIWLRAMFSALYENEPRVTIDQTHSPYYCFEWGQTSLFFHHGHKKRFNQIAPVFAGMYRDVFGRTKHSYAHMGHLHHQHTLENELMIVEQHPTLAAKDAYATRGGYMSQRGASVITYSKQSGEVTRSIIRPEMLGK